MFARIRLAAALLGVGTILAISPGPAAGQETVAVGDIWFCDPSFQGGVCDTVITVGDTVAWDFGSGFLPHTATECGASCDAPTGTPLWDSGLIEDGSTFQFTFTEPGTYLYYCEVHPFAQRGRIIVQGPPPPTATPSDGTVAPTTTSVGPPTTGQGPQEGSSGDWWALGATAVALAGLGAAISRRVRSGR